MGTIFTQVNDGTLKTYIQGESREIFRNSRNLIERAKAKGFKLTQRIAGNSGVGLTLEDASLLIENHILRRKLQEAGIDYKERAF